MPIQPPTPVNLVVVGRPFGRAETCGATHRQGSDEVDRQKTMSRWLIHRSAGFHYAFRVAMPDQDREQLLHHQVV